MPEDISWVVERRLELLELQLYWEGRFNRGSLVKRFNISVPQASADISRYLALAPDNMIYDPASRAYRPTLSFNPMIYRPSADLYLARMKALSEGVVEAEEVMIGSPPTYDVIPAISRRLDDSVVRSVVAAIRSENALLVQYQSFSSPQPRKRWLVPHAVAFDGRRWHARAFCCEKQRFGDFALGRIYEVLDHRSHDKASPKDHAWNNRITFILAPHPKLSDGMKCAVEADYGMTGGSVRQDTRIALAYYLYKQLGLDRDPEVTAAEEYHVVALNRDEIKAAIETGYATGTAGALQ